MNTPILIFDPPQIFGGLIRHESLADRNMRLFYLAGLECRSQKIFWIAQLI
jgi:hypothetical protein